jgi:hypothetical protein
MKAVGRRFEKHSTHDRVVPRCIKAFVHRFRLGRDILDLA